jgi:hypothetical protein
MVEVKLMSLSPNDVMELVRELRAQGLVQGKDFDFAYNQTKWDNFSYEAVVPQHTVFTFYVDKHATMFILKYGS